MKKKYFIFTFLISTLVFTTNAQGTYTDTTVVFSGKNRAVSIYVPSDYLSSTPAKLLIGLHGLGDRSSNYIKSITRLFPESLLSNTLIICPDGGNDDTKDFYTPAGDEAIIQTVIDLAKNKYNIDVSEIVLQGFSLGGRSALKYGLDNPGMFKALLLNTPAIQGVKEAVTGTFFNYVNASQIPIYISCGIEDDLYNPPIDSLYLQLVLNNGKVRYKKIPIGHTIPNMNQMSDYSPFINSQLPEYDIEVVKVHIPVRSCAVSLPFTTLVQNKGSKTITSIRFSYDAEADTQHYVWTGSLNSFQHKEIHFPNINIPSGFHYVTVAVDSINNDQKDTLSSNNEQYAFITITPQSKTLPYRENSSNPDAFNEWISIPSGDYYCPLLNIHPVEKGLFSFNTFLIFDTEGKKEEITSPLLDLTSIDNPTLSFNVAYKYSSYSFMGENTILADTLEVLISTNCGETYTSLYKKGGEDLLTFNKPFENAFDLNTFLTTVPSANDWRTETINLAAYSENTEAIIKFSYISDMGGLIFLDEFTFFDNVSIRPIKQADPALIFPNPVHDVLHIEMDEIILQVTLYTMQGQQVVQLKPNCNNITVSIADYSDGIYIVNIVTEKGSILNKKIIKH